MKPLPIIDLHVDIPDMYAYFSYTEDEFFRHESEAPVTLNKIRSANIDVVGLSLYYDSSLVKTSFYDGVKSFVHYYNRILGRTDDWHQIINADDLRSRPNDKIGYLFTIEGFDCFRDAADFEEFYDLGVRIFAPTWDNDNIFACGRKSRDDQGLTTKGKDLIKFMNSRKLLMDITHASKNTIGDLRDDWEGMMIATHSNVNSVHSNIHNLSDDEIQAVVVRDGVVGLLPLNECTGDKGTFEELYRHVDYIASRWGLDYVGFSSDIYPMDEYPFNHGYKDIEIMRHLAEYLLTRMSEAQVKQVMHDNWNRVLVNSL